MAYVKGGKKGQIIELIGYLRKECQSVAADILTDVSQANVDTDKKYLWDVKYITLVIENMNVLSTDLRKVTHT